METRRTKGQSPGYAFSQHANGPQHGNKCSASSAVREVHTSALGPWFPAIRPPKPQRSDSSFRWQGLCGEAVYVVGHSATRHSLWRELAGSHHVTDVLPLIRPGMHTCATAGNDTCMGVFFAASGLEGTQMSYS